MCVFIEHIVGELDFFKGDCLFGELFPGEGRVRVKVEPCRQRWVSLPGHQPRRPVVGVAVALVVHRHDVHQHGVLGVGVHAAEAHSYRGEHTSAKKKKWHFMNVMDRLYTGRMDKS